MASSFRRANKSAVYLKLAITGPSGSGKTTAALRLARGLVGPKGRIAVIDTENSSSLLYADSFDFDVCVVEPPYTEDKFIKALADASGNYDCVVIDSFSHVWQAILEYKSKLDMRGGNSYTNWANAGNKFENVLQAFDISDIQIADTSRDEEHDGAKVFSERDFRCRFAEFADVVFEEILRRKNVALTVECMRFIFGKSRYRSESEIANSLKMTRANVSARCVELRDKFGMEASLFGHGMRSRQSYRNSVVDAISDSEKRFERISKGVQ